MIKRKSRAIQTLPVSREALDVDILSILQLKLYQVNMNGMSIFREVLEVPRFRRAGPGHLGDIRVEMLSVEQYCYGLAHVALLLVQGEEFWIPDALGFNERRNRDQGGGQGMRMHDWEDEFLKDELSTKVEQALSQVPAVYRWALLLADVEELSYQEIAKVMNCPIGTVMSRINRGRRTLARLLRSQNFDQSQPGDIRPKDTTHYTRNG